MAEREPRLGRPNQMRTPTLAIAAVVAVMFLAGCGDATGPVASDPVDDGSRGPMPTTIPAAPGQVATRGVVTVLDDGRPWLCLGPVAESWPPQCTGPPLRNWRWQLERLTLGQDVERAGAVRWARYFLTGTWDGRAFTVLTSIPEALYDPPSSGEPAEPDPTEPDPTVPDPPAGGATDASGLERIARELSDLPGALASWVSDDRARVDVTYDDGSLQEWADAAYGEGAVVVTSLLVDVDDPGGP